MGPYRFLPSSARYDSPHECSFHRAVGFLGDRRVPCGHQIELPGLRIHGPLAFRRFGAPRDDLVLGLRGLFTAAGEGRAHRG